MKEAKSTSRVTMSTLFERYFRAVSQVPNLGVRPFTSMLTLHLYNWARRDQGMHLLGSIAGFVQTVSSKNTTPRLASPSTFLLGLIGLPYRALGRIDFFHPLFHLAQTLSTCTIPPHSGTRKDDVASTDFAFPLWKLIRRVRVISLFGELD